MSVLLLSVLLSCSTREPGMCAKLPMAADGIVRLSKIEVYPDYAAYESHIASEHFQKYKQGTLHMIKTLVLSDQTPLNPANRINNFIQ